MTYPYPGGGGGARLKEAPNFFKKAPPPPRRVGRPLSKGLARSQESGSADLCDLDLE